MALAQPEKSARQLAWLSTDQEGCFSTLLGDYSRYIPVWRLSRPTAATDDTILKKVERLCRSTSD